jgi:hypothetical protein
MKVLLKVFGCLFALFEFFVAAVTPMPSSLINLFIALGITLWLIRGWKKSKAEPIDAE